MNFTDLKTLNETILMTKTYRQHTMPMDYEKADAKKICSLEEAGIEDILNSSLNIDEDNILKHVEPVQYGIFSKIEK